MEVVTATDESTLPNAVDELYRAVGGLIDARKELVGGVIRAAPSLYELLLGEIPAKRGDRETRGVARSLPNCFLDAIDLRVQIDGRVKAMHPAGRSTPERLRALAVKRFRPQDTRQVREYTAELQSFALSIRGLAEPEHVKEIAEPCPSCGKRYWYRQHGGEKVRTAALQLIASQGCTCLVCKAFWPPERFLWLARLIGHDAPAGVVLDQP